MRTTITIALALAAPGALGILAGCAKVDVDVSDFRVPGTSEPEPAPEPDLTGDPRSTAQLRAANVQLRQRVARLEASHDRWKTAIDRKEDEIEVLKDQRHDLKKQRDRAKDALDD